MLAHAGLLADVRHDDDDVHDRADGDVADGRVHARLRHGRRAGLRPAAAAAGAVARPDHERRDAAVLRMGVRSVRPREHDADRLRPRRHGDDALAADARQPGRSSCCSRAWCSSAGARSSRCSRPRSPTRSGRSTPPPTTAASTWRRASARCSADRSPRCSTSATGSWIPVFTVIITMDFATAALAIFALKPMRRRWLERAHLRAPCLRSRSRQIGLPHFCYDRDGRLGHLGDLVLHRLTDEDRHRLLAQSEVVIQPVMQLDRGVLQRLLPATRRCRWS